MLPGHGGHRASRVPFNLADAALETSVLISPARPTGGAAHSVATARLDRAIQSCEASALIGGVAAYWIPAFAWDDDGGPGELFPVAASSRLNLFDSVIAGLAALKGPRHGGAGVLAARLLKTLVDGDVAALVRERVALAERFAGFGHGVYKHGDARARALLDALARAGASQKPVREIPDRILEATGEFVNIDYALAVLVHVLVRDGAHGGLDRACLRAVAARRTDPPARALYRFGTGARCGVLKGKPAGGTGYYRGNRSATLIFSPANLPPASMLLQSHQALFRSKARNILVSRHSA